MPTCKKSCSCTCSCEKRVVNQKVTLKLIVDNYYFDNFTNRILLAVMVIVFTLASSFFVFINDDIGRGAKFIIAVVVTSLMAYFYFFYVSRIMDYVAHEKNDLLVSEELANAIASNGDAIKEHIALVSEHVLSGKSLRFKDLYRIDLEVEDKRIVLDNQSKGTYKHILDLHAKASSDGFSDTTNNTDRS